MTEAPKKIPENLVVGYPEIQDTSSQNTTQGSSDTVDTSDATNTADLSGRVTDTNSQEASSELTGEDLVLWASVGGTVIALCVVALMIFLKKK